MIVCYFINYILNKSISLLGISCIWPNHSIITYLLFDEPIYTLKKLAIQTINGISLYRTLTPNINLNYINIYLQTLDNLFILLNGIVTNVKIMIVKICQKQLLSKQKKFLLKYITTEY